MEPGESEDDIFSSTSHNIEEVFLGDLFDVCIEDASIVDHTSLVYSPAYIADCNRGGKFLSRESVFPDKLSVNVGDICTRVYQHRGVNDF